MIALKNQTSPDVRCKFPFLDDDGVTYHYLCKNDELRVGATCKDIQGNWGYCKYRNGKKQIRGTGSLSGSRGESYERGIQGGEGELCERDISGNYTALG